MTRKDKELLLQDLCARLPYRCTYKASRGITHWNKLMLCPATIDKIIDDYYTEIKPYLRPMSSMTDEENEEYIKINLYGFHWGFVDWCNSKHFDYRGLIPKGLAIEAPKGMYYLNEG